MRRIPLALCLVVVLGACGSPPASSTNTTLAATAAASTTPDGVSLTANGTVTRVVDGDTVDVRIGGKVERVRLIGIDTPETVKPNTPVQCYGPEASAYTKSLLPKGTPVHLERDVDQRDVYGRLLAYIYRVHDGLFVNLDIIAKGYAHQLTIPPNVAHVDDFTAAVRTARQAVLGLWRSCGG